MCQLTAAHPSASASDPAAAGPARWRGRRRSTRSRTRRAGWPARGRATRLVAAFLDKDCRGGDGHPKQTHDSECEERKHQACAASGAVPPVTKTRPKGSQSPPTPPDEEVKGRPAMAQARVLQWGWLVETRDDAKRSPSHPRTSLVPGHEGGGHFAGEATDDVGRRAEGRPGEQIAPDAPPSRTHHRRVARTEGPVGAADGSIIATVIVSQIPVNQGNAPRSVPGPASMPRISRTATAHARSEAASRVARTPPCSGTARD